MEWFKSLFRPPAQSPVVVVRPRAPELIMPRGCLLALQECIAPALGRGHEGVAYLLGKTDGTTALCVQVVRPRATTGPGSFFVSSKDMARVIGHTTDLGLQVVGQVHSHPRDAFHSDGDEDGANIRYDGFFSIVLPDYGARLPNLSGVAVYAYSSPAQGWSLLGNECIRVLPGGVAL